MESSNVALEYGDRPVDENSPVNPDLHFDSQLMHLYVMTEKKVRKSTIHHINCCHHSVYEQSDSSNSERMNVRRAGRQCGGSAPTGAQVVLLYCLPAVCRPFLDKASTKWVSSIFGGKTPARVHNCVPLLLVTTRTTRCGQVVLV